MDLHSCSKRLIRSRPDQAIRTCVTNGCRPTPCQRKPMQTCPFSSSASRRAPRSQPNATPLPRDSARSSESPISQLFGDTLDRSTRSEPVRRPTPSQSEDGDANSTSSLATLLTGLRSPTSSITSIIDPMGRMSKPAPLKLEQAPFKLGPRLGRTVQVDQSRGRDVGGAFRVLGSLVKRNNVKNDFMSQRFHERPGLKRKRLKSSRYRARFKLAFKETVQRIQKMRRMGW